MLTPTIQNEPKSPPLNHLQSGDGPANISIIAGDDCSSSQLDMSTRDHIIQNLLKINVSEASAIRFTNFIKKMPGKNSLEIILKHLTQEKNPASQREQYYQISNYIAEFYCTLSNAGFFAVGFNFGDYSTLTAGLLSALSHTIPFQSLQVLDYLGVLTVFAKAASEYNTIAARPTMLAWAGGAVAMNVLDTAVAKMTKKYYPEDDYLNHTVLPSLHVTWHLTAAFALYEFNKTVSEINKQEFDKAAQIVDIIFIALTAGLYGIPLLYCAANKIFNHCKNTFFHTPSTISEDNSRNQHVDINPIEERLLSSDNNQSLSV